MKRWIILATVLAVAAAVLFVDRRNQTRAESAPQTVEVTRGTVSQEALALGSVVPEQEISVKSKLPGIVNNLHVAVGDQVRAGDPIIDIRPDPTPLEVAEAERALQIARLTEAGTKRDLDRAQGLYEQGLLSDQELEATREDHERTRLQAQLADERLALLRSGRAKIEGHEVSNRVVAPADGTILTCDVHTGDPVVPLTSYQAGTVLLTMADMHTLIFRGTVDEVDVGKLQEGQDVEFTVGAIPDETVRGRLVRISPKARIQDSATIFDVEAAITDTGTKPLRAGYSATARISIARAEDVLVLPERVVRYEDEKAFVRIPSADGKAEEREIRTGLSDGLTVVVEDGLNEGDRVLEPDPSPLARN